jgi:hypothetical protein
LDPCRRPAAGLRCAARRARHLGRDERSAERRCRGVHGELCRSRGCALEGPALGAVLGVRSWTTITALFSSIAPFGATVIVVPFVAVVPPGVTERVVKIPPYVGAASPTLMTPVVLVAVVGQTPLARPWMCWTWGKGLPVKVAASPWTCPVIVATSPCKTSLSELAWDPRRLRTLEARLESWTSHRARARHRSATRRS